MCLSLERLLNTEKVKSPETSLFYESGRCKVPLGETLKEDGKRLKESDNLRRRGRSLETAYIGKRTDSNLDFSPERDGDGRPIKIYETLITPEKEVTFTGYKKDLTPFKVHTGRIIPESIATVKIGTGDGLKRQKQYLAIMAQKKKKEDGETESPETDGKKVRKVRTRTEKIKSPNNIKRTSGVITILRKKVK